MTEQKPILVGEDNPYGSDERYALYPFPRGCAGHRLCEKVMGLTDREYLARFHRTNLCTEKWRMCEARESAVRLMSTYDTLVLCGAKVASAFGFDKHEPFTITVRTNLLGRNTLVQIPHPSGLSRAWNESGAFERARSVLREAGVLS